MQKIQNFASALIHTPHSIKRVKVVAAYIPVRLRSLGGGHFVELDLCPLRDCDHRLLCHPIWAFASGKSVDGG